jgi:putative transposase
MGRAKGSHLSSEQRQRLVDDVMELKRTGVSVSCALRTLGIARSTYYGWQEGSSPQREAVNRILPEERSAILDVKAKEPQLCHRAIAGTLRQDGIWLSESSCYRVLASEELVSPYERRPSPWQEPRYEPIGPNLLWGEDWTGLQIECQRWYLLVLLDLFSRLIVSWSVVKTVTHREVQDLLAYGLLSQGIDGSQRVPRLRADRGSPNLHGSVRSLLQDLGGAVSYSRPRRPTDNSRVERVNGTLKQEEIYCQGPGGYLSVAGARQSLGRYIDYYNQKRPHQSLWNFTPAYVHQVGNKTKLLEEYREKMEAARIRRLRQNSLRNGGRLSTFEAQTV